MTGPDGTSAPLPGPIRTTHLVIRCWEPRDAPMLKEAVDSSLTELRLWMPWALTEPSPLESISERIAKFRRAFVEGRDWVYGIFDENETRVIGGTGLHPRTLPGRLEIGYWVRSSETGKGYGTEAAAALMERAFREHGVVAVEIRCVPRNERSAAIPRRLGFRLENLLEGDAVAPDGSPRDTQVWVREAAGVAT